MLEIKHTFFFLYIPLHIAWYFGISLDFWQSVFLSIFSLKENGTRHGRGTHEKKKAPGKADLPKVTAVQSQGQHKGGR